MKAQVFSKPSCAWCERAVAYMSERDIDVERVEIITEDGYKRLLDSVGEAVGSDIKRVPQIVIDGKYVGGYQDAVDYIESNGNKPQRFWPLSC